MNKQNYESLLYERVIKREQIKEIFLRQQNLASIYKLFN